MYNFINENLRDLREILHTASLEYPTKSSKSGAVLCLRHKGTLQQLFYQDDMPSGINWTMSPWNFGSFELKHFAAFLEIQKTNPSIKSVRILMSVKTRKIMNHCAVWHKINANHKRTKNRAALHDLCYPYGWQAIPMGGRPYLREIKALM